MSHQPDHLHEGFTVEIAGIFFTETEVMSRVNRIVLKMYMIDPFGGVQWVLPGFNFPSEYRVQNESRSAIINHCKLIPAPYRIGTCTTGLHRTPLIPGQDRAGKSVKGSGRSISWMADVRKFRKNSHFSQITDCF